MNVTLKDQARAARMRGDKYFNSVCRKHGKVLRYSRESAHAECVECVRIYNYNYKYKPEKHVKKIKESRVKNRRYKELSIEADSKGLNKFIGAECEICGTSEKYACNYECVECKRIENKEANKVKPKKRARNKAFRMRDIGNCILYSG